MRRQLIPALLFFAAFTVVLGLVYPLVVTGVTQLAFPGQADGSLVERDGRVVGSRLIGQQFTGPRYFHSRPSAADYDGAASGATNLGPTNRKLLAAVKARIVAYRRENGLAPGQDVPVEAVTSSASGLDPHISVADARLQAPRVAATRGLPLARVFELVDAHTDGRSLGFLGESGVNVLELNLALDERG